jgi:predicted nucleic acid-binding protein
MVRRSHVDALSEPIAVPDGRGTLTSTALRFVFPVVVDANVIRNDLLRVTRTGQRTMFVSAANYGVLRVFCAQHVFDEVEEHLSDWAAQGGVRLDDARRVWAETYVPLLRVVDVPQGLTSRTEQKRLDVLGDRFSGLGDPDDVPTATLALLLGAPLMSADRRPLTAVYGGRLDYDGHVQWLRWLRATGNLGALDKMERLSQVAVVSTANAAYRGLRALAQRVPWSWLVALPVAATGAVWVLTRRDVRRKLATGLETVLEVLADASAEAAHLRADARNQLDTLLPERPTATVITNDRNAAAGLVRDCLYELARSPRSHLSAVELRQLLPRSLTGAPRSVDTVRVTLRSYTCFGQPTAGRFQVGRAARPTQRRGRL